MMENVNLVLIFVFSSISALYIHREDYQRANFYLLLAIFNLATMIYFK